MLPPAINFLQNFNDDNFDVLIQAKDYYKFAVFTLLALGLLFQIPVGAFVLGAGGHPHARLPHAQLALRDRHHRDPRRGPARRRPGHDDARDGPALLLYG